MAAFPRIQTTTITDVVAVMTDYRLPGSFDAVFDLNAKLSWLNGTLGKQLSKMKGRKVDTGPSRKRPFPGGDITEHVEVDAGSPAVPVQGLESIPAVEEQIATLARWDPSYYVKSLVMSKKAILKAANTKDNLVKYVDSKINNLRKQMSQTLNNAIEGSKNDKAGALEGFKDVFTLNGVYAELDPAKFPTWQANINTAPGSFATNGRKLMNKMFNDLTIFGEGPSIVFMGSNMIERFDAHVTTPGANGGQREFFQSGTDLHVGYINRIFNNIPVVLDKSMDADTLQFMADDFLYLDVHRQADMDLSKPMGFTDKSGVVRHLEWMGALTIMDRRRFGQISNWVD